MINRPSLVMLSVIFASVEAEVRLDLAYPYGLFGNFGMC